MSDSRPDRWDSQAAEPSPFDEALRELRVLLGAEPLAMDQAGTDQEDAAVETD